MMNINKIPLVVGLSVLAFNTGFSQPQPKKNPATQKELEQRQNAALQQLDKLTPEQRKMMEDMGIKIPATVQLPPNVTDKQFAKATGNMLVPELDNAKIGRILKTPLNSQTVVDQLKKIDAEILKAFSQTEIAAAEQAWQMVIKKKPNNATAIANASVQLWIFKEFKAAVYISSKNCINNAADGNSLNNHAAFLTMAGAEQLAIPFLEYLDKKNPENSSILNNLAQAWFGLGALDKAELYATKTIKLCSWHPQANTIVSAIEEKKGNSAKATEAAKKSIEKLFSLEKENRLRKLGYKLTGKDVSFPFKPNPDPLGLSNFELPPNTPKSVVEEIRSEAEWEKYLSALEKKTQEIAAKKHSLISPKQQKMMQDAENYMNGKKVAVDESKPVFYNKAALKLRELDRDGGVNFRYNKVKKEREQFLKTLATVDPYNGEKKILEIKQDNEEKRVGKIKEGGADDIICKDLLALDNKYLSLYNSKLDGLNQDFLLQTRLKLDEEIFWKQFMYKPAEFEIIQLDYQLQWLAALAMPRFRTYTGEYNTTAKRYCYPELDKKAESTRSKLANFNDLHCNYKSKLDLYWGSITTTCDKIETELKAEMLGIKLFETKIKQDMGLVKDWNQEWWQTASESFVNCTVEFGVEASKGIDKGPLKLEASVEGAVIIELTKKGISDVGIKAGAEIKAGVNTFEGGPSKEVTIIGVEATATVNGGYSSEGKGILELLNK